MTFPRVGPLRVTWKPLPKNQRNWQNTLSFYMDKPLENSGFQIICWTTEKLGNPDLNSGKTDFSSTKVINLCLGFPDSLFLIPLCSGTLLPSIPSAPAVPSSPALCGCSSHVFVSLNPDSHHGSPHPFLFLRSLHLSSYHFHFLTEKIGKLLRQFLLPQFQGLTSEKLPSSRDGALAVRSHSMPGVLRKRIYKLQ